MKTIGTKIQEARKRKKYTQEFVAEKVGVNRTNLSRIEHDKQSFTLIQLVKFCALCDVSADVILGIQTKNKKVYDLEAYNNNMKLMEELFNNMKK